METPCETPTMRRTLTAISRPMMTMATQAATRSMADEGDERRGDEQLVGQRVQELAQRGDAVCVRRAT